MLCVGLQLPCCIRSNYAERTGLPCKRGVERELCCHAVELWEACSGLCSTMALKVEAWLALFYILCWKLRGFWWILLATVLGPETLMFCFWFLSGLGSAIVVRVVLSAMAGSGVHRLAICEHGPRSLRPQICKARFVVHVSHVQNSCEGGCIGIISCFFAYRATRPCSRSLDHGAYELQSVLWLVEAYLGWKLASTQGLHYGPY